MIKCHNHKPGCVHAHRNPYKADFYRSKRRCCLHSCFSGISADFQYQAKQCQTNAVSDFISKAAGTVHKPFGSYACFPLPVINCIRNHGPHRCAAAGISNAVDNAGYDNQAHRTAGKIMPAFRSSSASIYCEAVP